MSSTDPANATQAPAAEGGAPATTPAAGTPNTPNSALTSSSAPATAPAGGAAAPKSSIPAGNTAAEQLQQLLAARDAEIARMNAQNEAAKAQKDADTQALLKRIAVLEQAQRDEIKSWIGPSVEQLKLLAEKQSDEVGKRDIEVFSQHLEKIPTQAGSIEDTRPISRVIHCFSQALADKQKQIDGGAGDADSIKRLHEQVAETTSKNELLQKENEQLAKKAKELHEVAARFYSNGATMQRELALREANNAPLAQQFAFSQVWAREQVNEGADASSSTDPIAAFTAEMKTLGRGASRTIQQTESSHRFLGHNPNAHGMETTLSKELANSSAMSM